MGVTHAAAAYVLVWQLMDLRGASFLPSSETYQQLEVPKQQFDVLKLPLESIGVGMEQMGRGRGR